ncbi:MAG: SagB/ThcOx family dehydrogenase [Candidatus Rokubacteria bacterium]|nr:SagB/ThcOx family dehydrogenase [Candidatus Rokubacteria bacterium]
MAADRERQIARRFHDRTAHSPASIRMSGHTLDWDVKPFLFKVYTDLPAVPLPRAFDPVSMDTLLALAGDAPAPAQSLGLDELAALLYHAAGVTRKKEYPGGGEVLFRAAPSTGALYQTEVYVAVGAVDGLEPGLYHFCPGDFALRRLRDGDVRGALAAAAAEAALARRAATVVLTAIYWRNTWKYEARAYRHLFWDSGTMLANLTAVAGALGLQPRLLAGFVDPEVNHLLGLDADREAALELVALGPEGPPGAPPAPLPAVAHPILPLSSAEVDYPALREIHRASMLETEAAVRAWRAGGGGPLSTTTATATGLVGAPAPGRPAAAAATGLEGAPAPGPPASFIALPEPRREAGRGLGETIQHRGSTRQFGRTPLAAAELATVLAAATAGFDADFPAGLVDLYLIVNAAEDIPPGAYGYRRESGSLELVRAGPYRSESAYLCLEQALGGDAAAVIYFLAPLDTILERFGNRGYRLANLEAGLAGGRAYLAAYAQGFGASGLTFYDAQVVEFFSPHAAGKDAIFVTALGRAARRATTR